MGNLRHDWQRIDRAAPTHVETADDLNVHGWRAHSDAAAPVLNAGLAARAVCGGIGENAATCNRCIACARKPKALALGLRRSVERVARQDGLRWPSARYGFDCGLKPTFKYHVSKGRIDFRAYYQADVFIEAGKIPYSRRTGDLDRPVRSGSKRAVDAGGVTRAPRGVITVAGCPIQRRDMHIV